MKGVTNLVPSWPQPQPGTGAVGGANPPRATGAAGQAAKTPAQQRIDEAQELHDGLKQGIDEVLRQVDAAKAQTRQWAQRHSHRSSYLREWLLHDREPHLYPQPPDEKTPECAELKAKLDDIAYLEERDLPQRRTELQAAAVELAAAMDAAKSPTVTIHTAMVPRN